MKKIIVANWKCKPATQEEAVALFDRISEGVKDLKNVEVVVCPPFGYLSAIDNKYGIILGAQNCFLVKEDAFGEKFSPKMAKDAGCEYIIVGHSSRRIFLGETDEMVNQELKDSLSAGLIPVVCFGETSKERQEGETEAVLKRQIRKGLEGFSADQVSKIIITYEPVWAISSGDPYATKEIPTSQSIKKVKVFIQDVLRKIYGDEIGVVRIIYGGSTNAENLEWILGEAEMEGLLVGGASLKPDEFIKMAKNA
jgi:triosephosphate isomerase (TIM)